MNVLNQLTQYSCLLKKKKIKYTVKFVHIYCSMHINVFYTFMYLF